MRNKKLMLVLLFLRTGTVMAQQPSGAPQAPQATVTSLMSKDLTELPGKEVLMIMVEYPPGCIDPIHRHNARAFVYVLEGSIVMQVKGGKQVTLTPGQTLYEGPGDVHVVGRNASKTKPAKFVVVLIKAKGAPVGAPAEQLLDGQRGLSRSKLTPCTVRPVTTTTGPTVASARSAAPSWPWGAPPAAPRSRPARNSAEVAA